MPARDMRCYHPDPYYDTSNFHSNDFYCFGLFNTGYVRMVSITGRDGRITRTYFALRDIRLGDLVAQYGAPVTVRAGRWVRFLTFERLQAGVDAQGGMRSRVRYAIFVWHEERNR